MAEQPVPEELQAAFDQFDEQLFVNVRAAFGGQVREAQDGAAGGVPLLLIGNVGIVLCHGGAGNQPLQ